MLKYEKNVNIYINLIFFKLRFYKKAFSYQLSMSVINIINFKYKRFIKTFFFTSFIFSKSFAANNLAIFENLNILQIRL